MNDLTVDELLSFQDEEKILYARDKRKSLYCMLSGYFEVWYEGEMVLTTMEATEAINKYNSI